MLDQPLSSDDRRLAVATERDVKAVGGLKVAAAETAIGTSQIERCYSTKYRDSISIRDAVRIGKIGVREAGHPHILSTMASILGAVVIMLPEPGSEADSLLMGVCELTTEVGDVARKIGDALACSSDGGRDVTPAEADAALVEVAALERKTATLRHQLERIAEPP